LFVAATIHDQWSALGVPGTLQDVKDVTQVLSGAGYYFYVSNKDCI